jgi:hypothetical protein
MEQNKLIFSGWNVDAIIQQIRIVLETPCMTEVDLNIHAAMDSLPTMTYTVTRITAFDK